MDKYKKREVDTYFFNKSMELDIKKAKEEGIKENQIIIARNLKKSGLDIKFISDNTGLSIEEIEKL